jgi:hypothetical protein
MSKFPQDRIGALPWLIFALLVAIQGERLGIGSRAQPESGFLFFWTGSFLAILSAIVVIHSPNTPNKRDSLIETDWLKVSALLAVILFYILVLERAGFVLSSVALVVILLKFSGIPSWRRTLAPAIFAALVSYAVFLSLGVTLP